MGIAAAGQTWLSPRGEWIHTVDQNRRGTLKVQLLGLFRRTHHDGADRRRSQAEVVQGAAKHFVCPLFVRAVANDHQFHVHDAIVYVPRSRWRTGPQKIPCTFGE